MNHVSLDIKLFMYILIRSVLWNDQTCISLNIFRILQFLFLKKSKNKKMLFNIRLYSTICIYDIIFTSNVYLNNLMRESSGCSLRKIIDE